MKQLFVLAAIAVLGLAGCKEVKVENGEIPAEYVSAATPYLGTYQGRFDGRPGSLELRMQGRRPIVVFSDSSGVDLLHPSCGSQIGWLESALVSEKDGNYLLKRARFGFHPGACFSQIQGRQVTLDFVKRTGNEAIDISLLRETRWDTKCTTYPGDPKRRIPPRYECHQEPTQVYMTGRFTR